MESQSMDSSLSEENPVGWNREARSRSDTHPAVGIASLCAGVPLFLTMAMVTIRYATTKVISKGVSASGTGLHGAGGV